MSATSPANSNPKPVRSRVRQIARGLLRFFRTALVVVLLIVAVLGLFLNKIGLPEFFKNRVIAQARAKGLEVQFSRLRLRWYRGIVAEDLQIRGTNGLAGPQIFVEQAECPLNPSALGSFELKMNSLLLRGGRVVWPLPATNQAKRTFVLNRLNGQLFFRKDGLWEARSVLGEFHGIRLDLSGNLANALMIRQWKTTQLPKKPAASAETLLRQIEEFSSQLKMAGRPELRLRFHGDGKDISTIGANLYFSVPGIESPWGAGTNLLVFGQLIPPPDTNGAPSVLVKLAAGRTLGPWGQAKTASLDLEFKPLPSLLMPTNASLNADLAGVETRWGKAKHLSIAASSALSTTNAELALMELTVVGQQVQSDWVQSSNAQLTVAAGRSLTNWRPAFVSTELRLLAAQSAWGDAQQAEVRAFGAIPPIQDFRLLQTNLIWAERLENLLIEASATFTNFHAQNIQAENVSLSVVGRSPQLKVKSSGTMSGGGFTLDGQLDTASRELSFLLSSRVDPQLVSSLLFTNSQQWLDKFSSETPPKLEAQGRLVLPAWSTRPDWNREVLPTIAMAGKFEMGAGAYRGVSFTSAQSYFSMTNLVWRMPELKLTRPEGALEAEYISNPLTQDFYWRIHSQIDVKVAQRFLDTEAGQAFDLVQFTTPPTIQAEIRGRWTDLDSLGVVAQVAMTNFTVRGESVKDCQTLVQYTNKVLTFTDSQVQRESGERGAAPGITLDLGALKLYFTNGFSTLNPYVAARAIGPTAIAAIAPYQFDVPPTVRVHGSLDLKRRRYGEDMHFEVSGQQFHWQQFRLKQAQGNVDWVGQTLTVTNVVGAFQTGSLAGDAYFNFAVPRDPDFSFRTTFDGADLREVAAPFSGRTNKLEGLLNGELIVTQANLGDLKSWQGYGKLNLRDGLIWDIPMFGIFSPVLNAFVPGVGNSRANEASATFLVTNGVFSSKDLEIRATMMRMAFQGTVGLNRRVDARVEAELLRDFPAIGFVISKVLWPVTKIFEYKVTGLLGEPKAEPLYVLPKVLLMPLHPFKTLKNLFTEEPKATEEKKPAP